ncbi:MAG: phenylacetate--CoA ligase, partial [Opitutaceae bacterium]|nr:phenylacetate--CoA ligase [Opitutaceae bacterium]
TGRPKAIFFSQTDIATAAELMARCLTMAGLGPGDALQNMMTYGLFTGALMVHYGAEKIGALVIPAGPGNSDRQLMLMRDFRSTAVHMTPSYALYFGELLARKGVNPRSDLALKTAIVGAESYTPATRDKIQASLGVTVFNNYGLSEMNGPGVAFECPHQSGLHLWEDAFAAEIIDPATGQNLPDGESGELVLTTLRREAMPLLRYRTRDITRILPEPCPCGRTHRKIAGITGRSDDMLVVRGVNIYPQQIESLLMAEPSLGGNYLITLSGADEMLVQVELAANGFDGRVEHLVRLQQKLVSQIRSETLVKPAVELLQPGSLPTSEGKARRVVDNRTL